MRTLLYSLLITVILFFIGAIYYFNNFIRFNESRIIEEARSGFLVEDFKPQVFDNKQEIKNFVDFLVLNSTQIVKERHRPYNHHIGQRDGSVKIVQKMNTKPCQGFFLKEENFKFSAPLNDSIKYHLSKIDSGLLYHLDVCMQAEIQRSWLEPEIQQPSVRLSVRTKKKQNGRYRVQHNILYNKKVRNYHKIRSKFGALFKSEKLIDDIIYEIKVEPNIGW